jgi:hypothetical protein
MDDNQLLKIQTGSDSWPFPAGFHDCQPTFPTYERVSWSHNNRMARTTLPYQQTAFISRSCSTADWHELIHELRYSPCNLLQHRHTATSLQLVVSCTAALQSVSLPNNFWMPEPRLTKLTWAHLNSVLPTFHPSIIQTLQPLKLLRQNLNMAWMPYKSSWNLVCVMTHENISTECLINPLHLRYQH